MKTFTHPAVARARKEAAEECARIAAEVSAEAAILGGYSGDQAYRGISTGADTVEERIRHRFGLESAASSSARE